MTYEVEANKKYEVLLIETTRDGYVPDQCDQTCTVGELMDTLRNFPEDMLVFFNNDNGYTYGSINVDSIDTEIFNEEEDEDDDDEQDDE